MSNLIDSGVQWIGMIPEEWKSRPLRYICAQRDGGAWGDEVPAGDEGTICLRIADFDYRKGIFADTAQENLTYRVYSKPQISRLKLLKGDILIEKSGGGEKTPVGRAVLFDKDYTALFANFMDRLRVDEKHALPEFIIYWLRAWYACRCSSYYINQTIGIQNLNLTLMMFNEKVFLPSLEKQRVIAEWIAEKCMKIDSLMEEIEAQINTLESLKKSIITKAVTKGLEQKIGMIDSGEEWIGDMPKHWRKVPFKYVLSERSEKNNPVKTDERLSLSIDKGITLYSEKTTNLDRFKDNVAEYKLAYPGDFVMNSMNMIVGAVGISDYFGCVSPAYYTFRDNEEDHCYCKFCDYIFHTPTMQRMLFSMGKGIMAIDRGEGRVNTCRLKVSKYDLGKTILPMPPIDELRSIVSYLDKKTSEIEGVVNLKKEQLSILEDYKNAFIYEYVTGKKEVPES